LIECFFATFLEKVAQKAAFRESLTLLGFVPSGWLARIAQSHLPIDFMRFDMSKLLASENRSALINVHLSLSAP